LRKEEAVSEENFVIAIYSHHNETEKAIKRLQGAGFNMKKLSIVGRDYHSDGDVAGCYSGGNRMKFWGRNNAFWGGLRGWLLEAAFFLMPGNLVVFGPLASAIAVALEGAVFIGGFGVLGAGLYSLGIPRNRVLQYETAIKADRFLLIGQGTEDEVDQARDVLQTTNLAEYAVHAA
jgi:hypothetical protein